MWYLYVLCVVTYRILISRDLHEGGVLQHAQLRGGNGAILPHWHGGSCWGQRRRHWLVPYKAIWPMKHRTKKNTFRTHIYFILSAPPAYLIREVEQVRVGLCSCLEKVWCCNRWKEDKTEHLNQSALFRNFTLSPNLLVPTYPVYIMLSYCTL